MDENYLSAKNTRKLVDDAMLYAEGGDFDDAYVSANELDTQAARAYNERNFDCAENYMRFIMRCG